MRPDMERVLTERPRRGSSDKAKKLKGSQKKRYLMGKMPRLYRGGGTKELSDYLSPLYRWMRKQVGRPWGEVWHEICQITGTGVIGLHLRSHVFDLLPRNPAYDFSTELRVENGILIRDPQYKPYIKGWYGPGPEKRDDIKFLSPTTQFQRFEGIWYFIEVRELTKEEEALSWNLTGRYGRSVLLVSKRQLGKKELKKNGLKNFRIMVTYN
jgi:hypothetical protein